MHENASLVRTCSPNLSEFVYRSVASSHLLAHLLSLLSSDRRMIWYIFVLIHFIRFYMFSAQSARPFKAMTFTKRYFSRKPRCKSMNKDFLLRPMRVSPSEYLSSTRVTVLRTRWKMVQGQTLKKKERKIITLIHWVHLFLSLKTRLLSFERLNFV